MILFAIGLLFAWRGTQNFTKFWAENDRAAQMPFFQYLLSYSVGSVFDKNIEPIYKKSREQFGVFFGFALLSGAYYMFAYRHLYDRLHDWFEVLPR